MLLYEIFLQRVGKSFTMHKGNAAVSSEWGYPIE